MLRMRLTGEDEKRMAKTYTVNPEAYQDYLQGRYWWNKRSEEGLNKSIGYFQQAISKDPAYALAYSGLADAYTLRAAFGFVAPKESLPKAKEAALKSLELDDTLADAHTSLGIVKLFDWNWSGGESEFQRAIALNPGYAYAHLQHGLYFLYTGQLEQALAVEKRALELDPLSLPINRVLGQALLFARQEDQAIQQEQKTLELDPNFALARDDIGSAYLQKSMYKEATTQFERALVISHGYTYALAYAGYGYAVAGRRAEAEKVLDQLNELSKHKYVPAECLARVYLGLAEKDMAFVWLEKGYDDRALSGVITLLKVDPIWDPLRSDPRFADLLRRMNLQP
jgi:tetratricopeptide (TPR) repeat protein